MKKGLSIGMNFSPLNSSSLVTQVQTACGHKISLQLAIRYEKVQLAQLKLDSTDKGYSTESN